LGRPVLEVFPDGYAIVCSGGVVESEGKLFDVLNKVYEAGKNGRTEDVNVVGSFVKGVTNDWRTGQVIALEESRIDRMIFDDDVVSLVRLKDVFRDTHEQLLWLRKKSQP
jgi:hypothetical protein